MKNNGTLKVLSISKCKIQNFFEESIFWAFEIYFFSGSVIDFVLHMFDKFVCNHVEVRSFWYILSFLPLGLNAVEMSL